MQTRGDDQSQSGRWAFGSILLVLCALLCAPRAVAASGDVLQLTVPSDGACIAPDELLRRIAARVGDEALREATTQRQIHVQITRDPQQHYTAQLHVRGEDGRELGARALDGQADCRALDDLLVVIISTWLGVQPVDGVVSPEETPPEPARALQQDPPAQPARARVTARLFRLHGEREQPVRWGAALAPALATGTQPDAAFGLTVAALMRWRALVVGLGLVALPRATVALREGAEARFSSVFGRLQGCVEVASGASMQGALCVASKAGATMVHTRGLLVTQDHRAASADVELGGRLVLAASSAQLFAAVSATLPVLNHRYTLLERAQEKRSVHATSPGVLVELGISWWGGS